MSLQLWRCISHVTSGTHKNCEDRMLLFHRSLFEFCRWTVEALVNWTGLSSRAPSDDTDNHMSTKVDVGVTWVGRQWPWTGKKTGMYYKHQKRTYLGLDFSNKLVRTQRLRNPRLGNPRFSYCHPDPSPNPPIPPPKTCLCRSLHSTMQSNTFPCKEGRVLRHLEGGFGGGRGGGDLWKPRVSDFKKIGRDNWLQETRSTNMSMALISLFTDTFLVVVCLTAAFS